MIFLFMVLGVIAILWLAKVVSDLVSVPLPESGSSRGNKEMFTYGTDYDDLGSTFDPLRDRVFLHDKD